MDEIRYAIQERVAGGRAYREHYTGLDQEEAIRLYDQLVASGETQIRLVHIQTTTLREIFVAGRDDYLEIPAFLRRQPD